MRKRNINANYSIFIPRSIENINIDIENHSKKEVSEKIESELDEYIYKNFKYTYTNIDNTLYITTFKDSLPISKKNERAIVPIYTLFRTLTNFLTNSNIVYIFASTTLGEKENKVVIVFFGNKIESYDYCFSDKEVIETIKQKEAEIITKYSGQKKITIYTDDEFDNINSNLIYLHDIDIKNVNKTEMIEYKSNLEMLFEKIHIKVKFNLDLKAFVNIILKSSLYFLILYMFYQNYNLQKQLDGFYKNLNQDIVKSMDTYQQQMKKSDNDSPLKKDLTEAIIKMKSMETTLKEIQTKLSTINDNKVMVDPTKPMLPIIDDLKKDLNNNLNINLNETKKDESITYEVLVQSVDYLKIKLNNKVLSLSNDLTTFNNLNLTYKNNTLYVNSKSFPLKTKGILIN